MEGTTSTATGSTTTGPTSFSDASLTWSGESSTPAPSSSTPAVPPSADATVPPAASAPDGSTPAAGEPPKERWDAILANARQKAADDAMAPYAWAKAIPQQEFQQIARMAQRVSTDPIGHLQELIAELRTHPEHGAALRSLTGRALAQLKQQQAAPQGPDLTPIKVQLDNGQEVGLYSADQIKALQDQWRAQVQQDFQPVTKTLEDLKAEREAAAEFQESQEFAAVSFQDIKTWPGMDDVANHQLVAQEIAHTIRNPRDKNEVLLATERAWRRLVAPKQAQAAEAKLLDSLKTKATASTSVNPGSAVSSSPRGVTSFFDKSLSWK